MKIFCDLNNINKKIIVITETQSNILKHSKYLKEDNKNISDELVNEVITKLNRYINESYGISKGVIALSNYIKELILGKKIKEIEVNKLDDNLIEHIYSLVIDLPTDETKLEDLYLKRKKDIKTVRVVMTIRNYNFTDKQSYENYTKDKGEIDLTQTTSYKEMSNKSYGFINFSYVSISGQPTKSFYSDLNHEISHYYEQFMAGDSYGKPNKMINTINNFYNDEDIVKLFAKTLYYCDEAEQDSAINGLYSYVINNVGDDIDFKNVDNLIKEDAAFKWLTELEYNVQTIKDTDLAEYKKLLAQKFNIHNIDAIIKYFEKQLHRFYKKFDRVIKGIKIELKLTESVDKERSSLPYQLLLNDINKKTIVISEQQAKSLKQLNEKRYHINTDIELRSDEKLSEETVPVYNRISNETRNVSVKKLRLENKYLGKADLSVIPEIRKGTLDEVIFKINSCICEAYGISQGIRKIGQTLLNKISEKRKNNEYEIGEKGEGYETRIYKTSLTLPNKEEDFGDYYLYDKTPENKKKVNVNITVIEYYFKSQNEYRRYIKKYGEDLDSWTTFSSNKYMSAGFLTVVYPSIKGYVQGQFYSNLEHEITHFYQQNRMDKRYPNAAKIADINNNMFNNENEIIKKVSRILYLCDDAEQEATKHGMYAYVMKSMVENDIDPRNVDELVKNDTAFKYLTELETLVQWLKNNKYDVEQVKGKLKEHYGMRSVGQLIRYAEHKLERFYRLFGRTIKKIKKDKGMLESVDATITPIFALMEYDYEKSPKLSLNEDIEQIYLIEAELKDIYQKYYNNIPEETFWQIVKADPTYDPQKEQKMGKYGKWLLNLFKQNKLKLEDLYKATEYLQYFVKYYNKIQEKDINKYDSLPTLFNVIKPFKDAAESGNEMATSKSDEIRKIKEDAEKFYEDDTWLVVVPHTQEAACYYGKNTEWCTAATSSYNMFNHYYNEGLLYININKKTNRKYQFHFETNSFMDENDEPINTPIISNIPLTKGLLQKYIEKYKGLATILLTVDVDLNEDEVIIGQEPYYSYITYDGYSPIVQVNGDKIQYCVGDLDTGNEVRYIGNHVFSYFVNENEDYDDDYAYLKGEYHTVIYNASANKTIDNVKNIFPINSSYITYFDPQNNKKYAVDANFDVCWEGNAREMIRNPKDRFSIRSNDLIDYNDNIVTIGKYLNKEEMNNGEGYGKDYINKVYNLQTKQYIIPQVFANNPYGYMLNAAQMKDGKYYMIYQGRIVSKDGYEGQSAYVIVYPDGSLSEIMNESVFKKYNLVEAHHSYNNGLEDISTNIAKKLMQNPKQQEIIDGINVLLIKGNTCFYDSRYNNLQVGEDILKQCIETNDFRRLVSLIHHELGHKTNYEKSGNNYSELKKDFETPLFLKLKDEEYKNTVKAIYRFQTREMKARCFETTMFLKHSNPLPSLQELYNDRCTDITLMREFINKLENITENDDEVAVSIINNLYMAIDEDWIFKRNVEWKTKYKIVLNWFKKQFIWFKNRIDKIYSDFKNGYNVQETLNNKLQTIITETVKNRLFEQYLLEATLDDIYTKYYSNIPQEEFWQIIKTDPTWSEQSSQKMGKYGKWLLNQYKQGKLKMEDLYKYRESLEAFHKYNRQLEKKDIMAYGDGNQLYDAVKQFIENPDQATSKSDEVRRMKQNAEKVYEDDEWLILIPKSEDAAKYYGKGTRWCTAAEHNNYFNHYNEDGPLYININKQNGEKYQFHFETNSFMDSADAPIPGIVSDTIELSDGAIQYYKSIGKGYEVSEKEWEDPDAEPEEETLFEGDGWSVTKYPDGDYVYIYDPHGEHYEIDLYNPAFEEPACNIFPKDVINALYEQLSNSGFYNLIFGTDSRVYSYLVFENPSMVLQLSRTEGNNNLYDAILFQVNDDYTFELITDFSENGLYMTTEDENNVRKNTGFGNIYLHDPQTNKMNIYDIKKKEFMFKENIDRFCGFYMPSGYIFSVNDNVGYVNVRNSDISYTIPPMNKNQVIEMIGAKENIGVVKFKEQEGYGIYILDQNRYAFDYLVPSFTMIESNNENGSWTRTTIGVLTKNNNEKYISSFDVPSEINKKYNFAASYYPNSEMPVVLNDGSVMTRTQYWRSQGDVYDILMQVWERYI